MKFHPVADLFPLMSEDDAEALALDIAANGLREDIWTFEDMIIDGRNRYNACLAVDEQPRFRVYEGEAKDLVSFVVSLNLRRRHLTESQRAMVAAKIANFERGGNQFSAAGEDPQICVPVSQVQAGEMLNVSARSVSSAKKVLDKGVPELAQLVESGEIPVSRAATIASMSPKKQKDMVKSGRAAGKKLVAKRAADSLKHTAKGSAGCLHCNPTLAFTAESVSAFMLKMARRATDHARTHGGENFAPYFEDVSFEIEEGELGKSQRDNFDKILDGIRAGTFHDETGIREKNDLQRVTRIPWPEFNLAISTMLDTGMIEAKRQEGKTEMARGARKTLFKECVKVAAGETYVELEPEDRYHDAFQENW